MTDSVKFDPGIGELVINFNEFINNLYSQLMMIKSISQKRVRFKLHSEKIRKNIENNIAFYIGCLLWAYYIVNQNINSPKEITGNAFLYLTDEQIKNYDYLIQVNFLENYLDNYQRDVLYYTGQNIEIPQLWNSVLTMYTEFLELNNGFVKTKMTSDIVLPTKLKNTVFDFDIKEKIEEAIQKQDLSILISIDNLSILA